MVAILMAHPDVLPELDTAGHDLAMAAEALARASRAIVRGHIQAGAMDLSLAERHLADVSYLIRQAVDRIDGPDDPTDEPTDEPAAPANVCLDPACRLDVYHLGACATDRSTVA